MTRFVTKGRANPWHVPPPRRFRREGRTYLRPEPRSFALAWLFAAAVASPFVAALISGAAQ